MESNENYCVPVNSVLQYGEGERGKGIINSRKGGINHITNSDGLCCGCCEVGWAHS